ncbi:MAG: NAD(P)/FAD-dependent oxidoreductase [Nitrospirota bacterium]
MKDFDAIIIGSGIGGLISGGILTSKGLKTLIIEKNKTHGGYLSSFKRNGFIFDSAVDCISGVAPGGIIFSVLELLNVDKAIHFMRVNPIRVSIFPDHEIVVDADVEAYIERLKRLFPSESARITKFFETVQGVYNVLQSSMNRLISGNFKFYDIPSELLEFMHISYKKLLNEYFGNDKLKAILSDRCPFIGLPPSQVSAIAMIALIISYFKLGAYRPAGGFQKLADVLIDGIRKNGGRTIFDNGVKKILLDPHDHCKGVRCDNGEEYTARYVISNADFHHTFCNLLGSKYSSVATDMIKSPGISNSFFIVYTGVKGDVRPYSSIGYFPSYTIEKFFEPDMEFKENSTLGLTIASVGDSSRAPRGCHTVVMHEMTASSGKKIDKSKCTEKVIRKAENIIPDIRNRITVLDSATPQTLQRYTGNLNGAAFGWRQIPGFRGTKKHGIKNLYIAGHWGDMGSGVLASAYSGAKAASEILACEDLKIDI